MTNVTRQLTTHDARRAPVATETDAARAGVYRLLGRLLAAPPDARLLETLGALDVPGGEQGLAPAWGALRQAARAAQPDALDDEYHALFVGVGRGELMPYASWYLSGFIMSRALAALRRDLDALGVERQPGVPEPEDHASAVCEAMSLVIDSAHEIPAEVQRGFFNDHLARWMGRFFADLRLAQAARFYAAVGALGERFMEIETQYLEM